MKRKFLNKLTLPLLHIEVFKSRSGIGEEEGENLGKYRCKLIGKANKL